MKKLWKKWLREVLAPKAGPLLASLFIRFLALTMKLRIDDRAGLMKADQTGEGKGKAYLFAFWHNRLLMLPYFYEKFFPGRKLTVMISMSRDGEIIANTAARFGVEAARGSSSRSGIKAFVGMVRKMKSGSWDVGITPDGPRGPRYSLNPGVFQLAQGGDIPIIPIRCTFEKKWVLRKSWDRFQIPKPFTRCELVIDEPVYLASGAEQVDDTVRALLMERLGGE